MNGEKAIKILHGMLDLMAMTTTSYETEKEAVKVVTEAIAKQIPRQLTLGELRQMDGSPIWTETIGVEGSGRWEIVTFTVTHICPLDERITMVCLNEGQEDYELDTYGRTWVAYNRPPEGDRL